jgi:hypothetical protein
MGLLPRASPSGQDPEAAQGFWVRTLLPEDSKAVEVDWDEFRGSCAVIAVGAATRRITIDSCTRMTPLREGEWSRNVVIGRRVIVSKDCEWALALGRG